MILATPCSTGFAAAIVPSQVRSLPLLLLHLYNDFVVLGDLCPFKLWPPILSLWDPEPSQPWPPEPREVSLETPTGSCQFR